MKEYRIKEFNARFTIEIFVTETTKKCFRSPTTINSWKLASSGGSEGYSFKGYSNYCKSFKSLKAARAQIKRWRKGVVYHSEK